MKILVTGADGLLGSNLVRELLDRRHEISVLIQKGRKATTLDSLPLTRIEGDLLDIESIREALSGNEYIIHAAASTSIVPSRNEIVRKVNIEGTRNILTVCKEQKIKRMVYVSTANSFGFGSKVKPGVEGNPYLGSRYGLDYMDSKKEAHDLVMQEAKTGLPVVVVNPTFMIGPYDSTPSSGAMIIAVAKNKLPGYAPGGRNYIFVKDAAVGIANALTMGRIGACYIIGNENMNYKEAFGKIAAVVKTKAPGVAMPKWVILLYGFLNEVVSKLTGKAPTVSLPMAKISCDDHYFSADKAVKELKLPQTSLDIAIEDAYLWLKDNGYI